MHSVSEEFKNSCKALGRQKDTVISYVNDNGIALKYQPQEVELNCSGRVFKTCMTYFSATFRENTETAFHEKIINFKSGILVGDEYEYIDYGDFFVKDVEQSVEQKTIKYTCYDKMINFMKQYQPPAIEFPCSLIELLKAVCEVCNVGLYHEDIFNKNIEIPIDYYAELDFTYRDVLDQIAEVTASTIFIKDNKLYFSKINETGQKLGADVLKNIKIGEHFLPLNSLVLSREPQEDNIYSQDEEMIRNTGLSEMRFANNEIMDKRRDMFIDPLFEEIKGMEYYSFNAEEIGLCYFEPCDRVTLEDLSGNEYSVAIFGFTIKFTTGITEELNAEVTQSTTKYQYASTSEKRLKNTEIIVDKQQGEIKSIVEDTEENFTFIHQQLGDITYNVQTSGGVNLIRNSVMFLEENGAPTHWQVEGSSLNIRSSPDSINNGCISGNEFTLINTSASQTVTGIKADNSNISEDKKTYYSFGVRIKKSLGSKARVKIYNSTIASESYEVLISEATECNYDLYEIKNILPRVNSYTVELWSDAGAVFTDVMFSPGKEARTWTQANGEYMNTNVIIDTDGVRVKSNLYQGDYTIMSPIEFAGYSKASGQLEKTFYLQRDETHSKKMKVSDSVSISNGTMLPLETGNISGIVFI